jgi:hypothetical protein
MRPEQSITTTIIIIIAIIIITADRDDSGWRRAIRRRRQSVTKNLLIDAARSMNRQGDAQSSRAGEARRHVDCQNRLANIRSGVPKLDN